MAGTFGRAFGRELGKNTAKVVSNAIFGDSWSTPYRRVGRSKSSVNITIHNDLQEARMARIRNSEENARQNRLLAIDTAVLENVDKVAAIRIPNNEKDIIATLESLTPNMKNLKWTNGQEGEIRNQYSNALLYKYESLLRALRTINPKSPALKLYGAISKTANMKMMEQSALDSFIFSAEDEELTSQLTALSDVLSMRGWKYGQSFSAKYYNDKTNDILRKFKEGIRYYKKTYGESAETLAYSAQVRSCTLTGIIKKHIPLWASLFVLCAILFAVWMSKITAEQRILVGVLAAVIIVIVGYASFKIKAKRKNRIHALQVEKSLAQEALALKAAEDVETQKEDSEFIDLDIDNRIDARLVAIWDKYADVVGKEILQRKPIYAADGVNNSILFVGVNPSYNEGEDSGFIPSFSGKNLLYGSFYKRNDAPEYFKELESFAGEFGFTYSQINLLYVRENDRDALIHMNADFIREQLELTYDTIRLINPKIIIFFSDYCKNLVYGTDRWTRPDRRGDFDVLNGTDIPVIFTNDITLMTADSLMSLKQELKKLL